MASYDVTSNICQALGGGGGGGGGNSSGTDLLGHTPLTASSSGAVGPLGGAYGNERQGDLHSSTFHLNLNRFVTDATQRIPQIMLTLIRDSHSSTIHLNLSRLCH